MTAMVVRRFDMELWETDERDVAFLHAYQVAMPKLHSKGVKVLVKAREHPYQGSFLHLR